jgi:peroxiredoxin
MSTNPQTSEPVSISNSLLKAIATLLLIYFLMKSQPFCSVSKLQGQPAPDFSLLSLSGEVVQLSALKHKKPVVLSFWASWCGYCMQEMPHLQTYYAAQSVEKRPVEFFSINLGDSRAVVEEISAKYHLTFPILLNPTGEMSQRYGVSSLPMNMFIDPNGVVESVTMGYHQDIAQKIEAFGQKYQANLP